MNQSQSMQAGDNSILIQLQVGGELKGDVNIGTLPYVTDPIPQGQAERDATSLVSLLRFKDQQIAFVGRAQELSYLQTWVESQRPVAVLPLVGDAGRGKSRLALQFAQDCQDQGWSGFYLDPSRLESLARTGLARMHGAEKTLLIVENAAQHAPNLATLLQFFAKEDLGDRKIRILLVERHASDHPQGWLAKLREADED